MRDLKGKRRIGGWEISVKNRDLRFTKEEFSFLSDRSIWFSDGDTSEFIKNIDSYVKELKKDIRELDRIKSLVTKQTQEEDKNE